MSASPLAPEWLSYPLDANALDSKIWARDVERGADGQVTVGALGVNAIADTVQTPTFVLSEPDFRSRAQEFVQAFSQAFAHLGGIDVYYAGKSFLCTEVARWVSQEGLFLDTCSGGELLIANRAGVPGARIGLHGNNKSDAELRRALELGVGRIVSDSLSEVKRLGALAAHLGVQASVMLRLTPGVHAHTHEFIATAHEDQKFGLSMVDDGSGTSPAEQAVLAVTEHPNLELLGIHAHIGSQIFDAEGFGVAAQRLLEFAAYLRDEHSVLIREVDLGGGYGIAYTEADTPRPVSEIAEAMAAVVGHELARLNLESPRFSIEPGRAIVGPSTFTLYRVGTVKSVQVDTESGTHERRYVAVDGGMSDNPRPVLYEAEYTATLANRTSAAEPVLTRVVGKHCESGDIVVRDCYLPDDVHEGDLLAVPATGAYCWSLSSNYNYVPRPGVLAVNDGQSRFIVRAETEEDLISRDPGAQQ